MTLPPRLYKYRSFGNRDHVIDLLGRGRIFAPSPAQFNDPFDCMPRVDTRGDKNQRARLRNEVVTSSGLPPTRHERRKADAMIKSKMRHKSSLDDSLTSIVRGNIFKGCGVISLAEDPDNVLMWSHYGHSHTGFCVEFDTSRFPFLHAEQVTYTADRPVLYPLVESDQVTMDKALFCKAYYWAYEKEWRVVMQKAGAHDIPSIAMTGVILGARTSAENEAMVRELVGDRAVFLKRAVFDDYKFRLDIEPA